MCDKLVFDLSQEVEGTPNVFVRKDWINILDNQNQNYSNNQSVIDTSQLSNSNKYMSYREAYLSIPMVLTLGQTGLNNAATYATPLPAGASDLAYGLFQPKTQLTTADFACGLKNWFGNIIHSLTLEYNGTAICQQTPYSNMWNSFKLMTSLSLQDIKSQGAIIGFYPDRSDSFAFYPGGVGSPINGTAQLVNGDSLQGDGVCNNSTLSLEQSQSTVFTSQACTVNDGFLTRIRLCNFDFDGPLTTTGVGNQDASQSRYSTLMTADNAKQAWRSYIINKENSILPNATPTSTPGTVTFNQGYVQWGIIATIYLKHIHSFFNMCPLLKGVFMKLTLNLNNSSSTLIAQSLQPVGITPTPVGFHTLGSTNAIGGVCPILVASTCGIIQPVAGINYYGTQGGSFNLLPDGIPAIGNLSTVAGLISSRYVANLSVGARCLDSSLTTANNGTTLLSKSIYLYVPAYTFNPEFETAYLSSPVKQIKYSDIYQYQVINTGGANSTFNNLITNGIANIKSVLVLPFFSSATTSTNATNLRLAASTFQNPQFSSNTGLPLGIPVWQSPFDPAGCGPTSPLVSLTNFNVQISGQNAIYNLQKYNFEEFNNQLYGQNSVNGGLTDGLTSGLVGRQDFDTSYCYYYVNVERMLPVEMSVPKSVQILGTNLSNKSLDLYVFVEYGVEISIDALTGARV